MRLAALLLIVVMAGCATEADSPDIQRNYPPLSTIVPMTVPQLVPATVPPLDTVPVTKPSPLPAPTEPAVTEPVPGPESELDPDVCPQDPDEVAASEPPHPPPCD